MAAGMTARIDRRRMLAAAAVMLVAPPVFAQSNQAMPTMPLGPLRFQVKDYWHGTQQLTVLYTLDADEATQNTLKNNRQAVLDRLNTAITHRLAQDFGGVRGHELLKEILRDEVLAPLRIYPNDIFLTRVTLARRS
jgi:flagellar basal body-associated protein FliL